MARVLPCWLVIAALLPLGAAADALHAMPQLAPDPRIAALVAGVEPDRLVQTDRALVAFGTRNDFSETSSSSTHGVFGARDWIAARFREIAAGSQAA